MSWSCLAECENASQALVQPDSGVWAYGGLGAFRLRPHLVSHLLPDTTDGGLRPLRAISMASVVLWGGCLGGRWYVNGPRASRRTPSRTKWSGNKRTRSMDPRHSQRPRDRRHMSPGQSTDHTHACNWFLSVHFTISWQAAACHVCWVPSRHSRDLELH